MLRSDALLSFPWRRSLFAALVLSTTSCVDSFDTSRKVQDHALGEEVFGLVCDRVGAQSLRDDITGASYQDICHRKDDESFAREVDAEHLPELTSDAHDVQGLPVSVETQQKFRDRGIARVEAMADERDPLISAFTAMLPDVMLPKRAECAGQTDTRLYDALMTSLSGLVPLYEDQTVPAITRGMGGLFDRMESDQKIATALARINAREGYRPQDLALYVLRPLLAYPRLFDLGAALADVHRENRHGAKEKLQRVLAESARELQDMSDEVPDAKQPLTESTDPLLGNARISRPRSARELSLKLLSEAAQFGSENLWIVKRDQRGMALVNRTGGVMPYPFLADADGNPQADELGRFMTQDGSAAPLPFLADPLPLTDGRARQADGQLLYDYLPIPGSVLSQLSKSFDKLFLPRVDNGSEAMLDALELVNPLLGGKDKDASATFSGQKAPLVSFVHALTVTLTRPGMEDTLALFEKLTRERPEVVARLVRLFLALDNIADKYPNVKLRGESTLWDELIDVGVEIAQKPGMFEDLIRAFGDEKTGQLGAVFASWMSNRDQISYYRDKANPTSFDSFNGQAFNLTTNDFSDMKTPVDRSLPDTGDNRSVLQRFMQLLHDANGLTACSKDGAIAHVDITWAGLPVKLDYPTNPLAKTVCAFLGTPVTDHIPECGILRFDNVAALIIKVALKKYTVEVRDPCLAKLMDSPLTGLVGGAQAFLEQTSGIKGFGITPSVQGVARLAFFDAPYKDWGTFGGDIYYPKTSNFLKDVIDPVPSTLCPVTITTDPKSGEPIELRRCAHYEDTLRGRDPNGLFPLEQMDFLGKVVPLAEAFDKHDATLQFVHLVDILHRHWGSPKQTREECDPTLPKTDARWCSQDAVVAYEPMLAEMMTEVNLFGELAEIVKLLQGTQVPHCDARDTKGACVRVTQKDGVSILADTVGKLVDPAQSPGLVSRSGRTHVVRNDGTEGSTYSPMYLWLDALHDVQANFDEKPHETWLKARSIIIDTLLDVELRDGNPRFKLVALDAALPQALSLLREQLLAHCPADQNSTSCAWIDESVKDLSDMVESKVTAAAVDTLDALRADEASKNEIGRLLSYLSGQDEKAHASAVAALMDFLQVLDDDAAVRPLAGLMSQALNGTKANDPNALAPRTLDLLARFFAADKGGVCGGVDPHHAFAYVLTNAVTRMENGKDTRAPVEVLIDAALRVNRVNPRKKSVLLPEDMKSLGHEFSALMLDPASGLEQLYAVLRQVTGGKP